MDKQFYLPVIENVEKTLTENGFSLCNDGGLEYYSDEKRAFAVAYNDGSKQLELKTAVLKEGKGVDFKVVSSWMLDENSDERDLKSIGNDFSDTVLEQLGKKASAAGITKVELPSKEKNAETVTVDIFAARFLAIFPAYKPQYVQNVSDYGEFMYDKFFREIGPELVVNTVKSGSKKHISKLFELLNSCFVLGDAATSSVITFCILAPAVIDDKKIRKDVYTYLEKYTHLYSATVSMVDFLSKPSNKKKYLA